MAVNDADLFKLASWAATGDWEDAFDARSLMLGRAYADDGHVYSCKVEASDLDTWFVESEVKGSKGRVYNCSIEIDLSFPREPELDFECACPVFSNCKHAAAVLHYIRKLGERGLSATEAHAAATSRRGNVATTVQREDPRDVEAIRAWDRWFEDLAQSGSSSSTMGPPREFCVLLRSDGDISNPLLALPAWLRPSKAVSGKGSWVDPLPLAMDDRLGAIPTPPGGWPEDVGVALATLLTVPALRIGANEWSRIGSVHAERALETLLAAYPVYFERGTHALTRGPLLPVKLVWSEAVDGTQRLKFDIATDTVKLLTGAGLWYVDEAAHVYGRVDASPNLLAQLDRAPALPPHHVAALRDRLGRARADLAIPAPVDRGPMRVVQGTPQPVVHLQVMNILDQWSRPSQAGAAQLWFHYEGCAIAESDRTPAVRRVVLGELLSIQRNPAAEAHTVKLLRALGLVPVSGWNVRLLDHGQRWREGTWCAIDDRKVLAPNAWWPIIQGLESQGIRIEYSADFPHERKVTVSAWHAELESDGGNAWFNVSLGVDVDGKRIDLLPILRQILANPAFPLVLRALERYDQSSRVR